MWFLHGEKITFSRESPSKKNNCDYVNDDERDDTVEMIGDAQFESNFDPVKFQTMLEDVEKPIYPGCNKFTKLSTLLRLYNIKAKHGLSDKSFTDILSFLGELLPENNEMPLSFYEAKKTLRFLGMQYEKINACPNDCILYRKRLVDENACLTCGELRWQKKKNYDEDGKLRHPADLPAWKRIDWKWPEFGNEPRNIRLGLSADGINLHTSLSSKYSCCPVMLSIYNLPPWLCMKRKFTMLTLLISGPKQPRNDIDVYLAPLIDGLSTLWYECVDAYNAYRKEEFKLRVVLLWTINDFSALRNLSGLSVKGYKACPICEENTCSQYLKHSRKICYMGHRNFLPRDHVFQRWEKPFNGSQEFALVPQPLFGRQLVENLNKVQFKLGKHKQSMKRKRGHENGEEVQIDPKVCWKKKYIFFELEYWEHLVLRHNLDFMHIEKNVFDSLISTLLNIPGWSKDGIKAQLDLKDMGVCTNLAPKVGEK
ncbi:uncharacterized protein LOC133805518 [Humulus lupulus]|uniref:uncharacterized protein LOC133805518 n=1 Tax=Humulus lupulus TaxID=3486 RepID=UPI002B40867D|nr:uncharacterized protein LOC133805518 [Humulus lupulus]